MHNPSHWFPTKVLYLTGHPAEGNLSKPILDRLKSDGAFEVCVHDVLTGNPFRDPRYQFDEDIVISPCDRIEMVEPTFDAFQLNKPIVRIYGGLKGSGTQDDVIRHLLDTMGHIHLVESEEAKQNLIRFGEEEWRIHVTGVTHLDDMTVDTSLCLPDSVPYGIILMNPVTISHRETLEETMRAMFHAVKNTSLEWFFVFPPNGDQFSNVINDEYDRWRVTEPKIFHFYKQRIPRPEFLGLLSKAKLLISNSSLTQYEAPYFHVPVYNPSWRNQERTPPPPLTVGGSDRIVKVLKSINWSDENLLRKRFRYT